MKMKLTITPDEQDMLLPLVQMTPADAYDDAGATEFMERLITRFCAGDDDPLAHIESALGDVRGVATRPFQMKIAALAANDKTGTFAKWLVEPPTHMDDEDILRLLFTASVIRHSGNAKKKAAREAIREACRPSTAKAG